MSTENKDFDLQAYLTKGVEQVVTDAIKATLKDPKESSLHAALCRGQPRCLEEEGWRRKNRASISRPI